MLNVTYSLISSLFDSISDLHCKIMHKDGVFTLETFPNARTLRNGKSVTSETKTLKNNDRLLFGTTQFYVFCNPKDPKDPKVKEPDFEMAQAEIAEKMGGFDMSGQNKSVGEWCCFVLFFGGGRLWGDALFFYPHPTKLEGGY